MGRREAFLALLTKKMEYILTFKNTNFAMKAEHALLEQKLNINVLPLPAQISAGCGICLGLSPDEVDIGLKTLLESGIDEIGLFSRESADGQYIYTEIHDRCV